jgi:hypothetical protein
MLSPTKEGENDVLGCNFRTQVALKRAIETYDRHFSMLEPVSETKKSESITIFNNSLLTFLQQKTNKTISWTMEMLNQANEQLQCRSKTY